MQAQQRTNWCWAASGNTIATWFGRTYSQNQFCNAAFGRTQGYECPNSQATPGNVQDGLYWAGINPGSYVTGWLRYPTVQAEVAAGRPVGARGTTPAAYRARVREAYDDKLPGSGYARSGKAGGYAPSAAPAPGSREARPVAASTVPGPALNATSAAAGAGALVVLGLGGLTFLRNRRHRENP
ncbi:MYXO-CTERM domain-containing protein [Streptomyces atratus]|uniref:MYXO-CTERM domain-containing protein n=1 Tax=Streptomyces atratus TaxID=1893 RepID=A0A1K1TLD9_STRAR|nr:MYXO-CTERM domain-containing protein [Streptomyces atratus]